MAPSGPHLEEEIQDLLDGRLNGARAADVEAHLDSCAPCRSIFEQLSWVKRQVRMAADEAPLALPPADVRRLLDDEDRRSGARVEGRLGAGRWRWATVGALAATVLLALFWYSHHHGDLPAAVAADYRQYRSERLALAMRTADPVRLEAFFAAAPVPFRARVFDLGMMNYSLLGGDIHQLAGRPSVLFVYRGPDGTPLLCQMYLGRAGELPPADAVREHRGFTFSVYRRQGLTLVFWEEGPLICVLAGEGETEAVLQLAFAKAMRAI